MRTLATLFLLVKAVRAELPNFETREIANDLKGGYQVLVADVNGDGKPDLIALASGMSDLVWFENPSWKRHVLASGFNRMINCAFELIDGKPVIVLASEFNNDPTKSIGLVSVLTPKDGDPTQAWSSREIDRLPSSHRIRALKMGGRTVFLNLPLAAADAHPPDYRGHVPIVLYRPGVWKRELLSDQEEGVLHGVWVERDGAFLTASFLGIHRYQYRNRMWVRTPIATGATEPWPLSGSSDVASAPSFIAAIEPWHGNQVVVYDVHSKAKKLIDSSLIDGHTIAVASLDGARGSFQIIAGFRGKGTSVYLYDLKAGTWQRKLLDDKMAAASCVAADLDGDGKVDVACIGASSANLKWYRNLGL